MSKFPVGTHVRIIGQHKPWYGERGEVVAMSDSFAFPYTVEVYGHVPLNYSDTELALVEVDDHEANCPWCEPEPLPPVTKPRVVGVEDLVSANNAEFVAKAERKLAEKAAVKVTPVPVRSQILTKAKDLINGDRAKDYGDAYENFGRIADLWSPVLRVSVTPEQVALCMAQVKIARLITSSAHEDSWIDLAGYAALGGEIASEGA